MAASVRELSRRAISAAESFTDECATSEKLPLLADTSPTPLSSTGSPEQEAESQPIKPGYPTSLLMALIRGLRTREPGYPRFEEPEKAEEAELLKREGKVMMRFCPPNSARVWDALVVFVFHMLPYTPAPVFLLLLFWSHVHRYTIGTPRIPHPQVRCTGSSLGTPPNSH